MSHSQEEPAKGVGSEPSHVGDAKPSDADASKSLADRLGALPTGVGVVLLGVGAAGLVFPGPFGTPLLIAGGLVLAPRAFRSIDRFVQKRMPGLHGVGMSTVERFLQDLEKRYPRRGGRMPPGPIAGPTPWSPDDGAHRDAGEPRS